MPQPTMPNLSQRGGQSAGLADAVGLADGPAWRNRRDMSATGPNLAEAQSLLNTLAPPAGSNLPPLKIGLLSGSTSSVSGLGAVQYVNGPLQQAVSQLGELAAGPARGLEYEGL